MVSHGYGSHGDGSHGDSNHSNCVYVCWVQAKLVANGDVEELEPQDDMGRTDWRRQHIRKVCTVHMPEGEGQGEWSYTCNMHPTILHTHSTEENVLLYCTFVHDVCVYPLGIMLCH